jgi:iron complex transport system substrate-binding protein
MRRKHGSHVLGFLAAILLAEPAIAAPQHVVPQHVVSVLVCTDEYVFRLLPRERIAALSYLAADRHPVVSTIADQVRGIPLIRQNAEDVLAKHPDLVVTYAGVNQKLHDLMRTAGVPVLDVPWANSIADIRRVTLMLGDALGERARTEALLREMDVRLAAARAGAPKPPVRTLVYEPNGYVTAGGVSDEMMMLSGLTNAAPQMKTTRLGTLPIEAVIASSPELLILNGQQNAASRADLILHHPALRTLGHTTIAWAPLTPLLCPGPWSADAALTLSRLARKSRPDHVQ